ncbi:MAG: permease-like cell division protein FtsX [bacterium]|nr:permease-like cell division protein FtsX [bacterium]
MFKSIGKIFKAGWTNFKRNKWLSWMTVFAMVLTISLATSIFIFRGMADFLMESLEKKFDISVYFKEDSLEAEILQARDLLVNLPEVKIVEYVSKDQAMADFVQKHKDDDAISQALNELGDNPFLSSLNVVTGSVSGYDAVNSFLEGEQFSDLIEKVDYYERKPVIDKFYAVSAGLQRSGLLAAFLLAVVAFSITFVTIRLAIYGSSGEIGIMRLVGASNWFIRGPFLAQGMICGFFASLVVILIFLLLTFLLSAKVFDLTDGFEMFKYFTSNLLVFFGLQVLTGAGLGAVSSLAAVGKYLEK